MKPTRMLTTAAASAALGLLMTAPGFASDDEDGVRRAVVVDYSGRPPYDRRVEQVSTDAPAEFSRFEEDRAADLPKVGEMIMVVDTQGRPPFRRKVVEIDESNVTDFARFEEVDKPSEQATRRMGPPGKRNWRMR